MDKPRAYSDKRSILGGPMKALISACIIFVSLACLGAQGQNPVAARQGQRWQLAVQGGEIVAWAGWDPDGRNLTVYLEPTSGFVLPVAEESNALRQVVNKILAVGQDPRNLILITIYLGGTGYRSGVDQAVTKSENWRSCLDLKNCYRGMLVADQYLKSIDAFKAFDEVLRPYGLITGLVEMDDLNVGETGGRASCGGMIDISLERVGSLDQEGERVYHRILQDDEERPRG